MPVKTEALVAKEAGAPWSLEEVEYDDLAEDELLVEMVAVGLCYTDTKASAGKFMAKPPLVLGHEGSGYVRDMGTAISATTNLSKGDAVILTFASCGTCSFCLTGAQPYCNDIRFLNFAGTRSNGKHLAKDKDGNPLNVRFFGQSSCSRLAVVHRSSAVKVQAKDREELQKMVIGCGIQTGAGAVLNVARPAVGASIAIWGGGGVGLSAVMAAKLTGPKHLIVIDMVQSKLDLAKKYGATHTINGSSEDVQESIRRITDGRGVDFALDCAGSPAILRAGQASLVARGTLITVGGLEGKDIVLEGNTVIPKGMCYRACHQGDSVPQLFIPALIDMWKAGRMPFDELLSFYRFEDFATALSDMKEGKIIKPVLTF